ncbi:hypothetical protein ACQFX9_18300 [Aliinostoc sp. HNIBRCY26]|uniref:hypothetical protein n=1 Tax=Aliinostoc sp. HNIBRCY26 TaxID=3418997 RepID=UPI003D01FAAA
MSEDPSSPIGESWEGTLFTVGLSRFKVAIACIGVRKRLLCKNSATAKSDDTFETQIHEW